MVKLLILVFCILVLGGGREGGFCLGFLMEKNINCGFFFKTEKEELGYSPKIFLQVNAKSWKPQGKYKDAKPY